jgi:hypothetical protein
VKVEEKDLWNLQIDLKCYFNTWNFSRKLVAPEESLSE